MALRGIRLSTVLALLVLAGTVPLAFFAGILIRSTGEAQRAALERRSIDTARAITIAIDQHVDGAIEALRAMAELAALPDDGVVLADTMRVLIATRPNWRSVSVITPSGNVRTTAGQPASPAAVVFAREVAGSGNPNVSNLVTTEDGARMYVVAVPVSERRPASDVLVAEIALTGLARIVERQGASPLVVSVTDREATVMARSRDATRFVGQRGTDRYIGETSGRTEGSWQGVTLAGTAAYVSFSRSALTGWVASVAIAASEVEAPTQASFRWLTAAGIAILLLGALLAAGVGRTIVSATRAAADSARQLARGEPITPVRSPIAEIEALSSGLEHAAGILDERLRERDEAERQRAVAATALADALASEHAARLMSQSHELRLDVTLQSIGDAVIAADPAGRITIINRVAQALTGWTAADALGKPFPEVFRLIDELTRKPIMTPSVEDLCAIDDGRSGLPPGSLLVARDGREVPIEDSIAPIRAADGAVFGCVLVFRDVTGRREDERRRLAVLEREQQARRQAEALNRSKDDFVATMSHELRTPLNAIFGWVRLLRSGSLGETERVHALEVVERNTRALMQLVEDLLDMSRIITGRLRPEMRRVDLLPIVEAAIDVVRPTALNKGIEITASANGTLDAVAGDPDRLQQIVWNLLVNGIKFTPKGGSIKVTLQQEQGEVVTRVTDNGMGIAPHVLPYLFDQFWQGPPAAGQVGGGLGIGLTLVRRLVDLHGGSVTAESEGPGCGATFIVRLPALGSRVNPVAPSEPPSRVVLPQPVPPGALAGLRVLVVDDDQDSSDLVGTTLRQAGAEVIKAGSVAEGFALLDRHRPQVVLSDMAMPDATGYELVTQIRSHEGFAELPIIALTAYERLEDRTRALNAGFTYYIGKPVDPVVLVRIVASAVELRRD